MLAGAGAQGSSASHSRLCFKIRLLRWLLCALL